ncbi:MAG: carboxypeptidase-like regulatory domain-containing protein [Bacteroides sp.]|nr:carboxypeptidase-like regulatory domain-containing protein [Bacteroides sp.]
MAATVRLYGTVRGSAGEAVPYATVYDRDSKRGCAPDEQGSYSLQLKSGKHTIEVSAVGYVAEVRTVDLMSDTKMDFVLKEDAVTLSGVNVYGKTNGRKLSEGAFTVNAIELNADVNKLVKLKDIVDRSAGVKVRREGGVGSDYDLIINGLSGNSIRYFIDGVPLDSKGTDFNLDNISVNTVERIELYKGVVPSYLSSDALGGAVNIVTKKQQKNFLDFSYGVGSFHTQSVDLTGKYFIPKTKIAILPTFSLNYSKNDYTMKNVEVWDEDADKYIYTNKKRFHDDYRSIFSQIEVGVNDVRWADAFFIGASYTKVDKELQTGAMQNKVYGEASRNSHSMNVSARYAKRWEQLNVRLNMSHTWDHSETVDTAYRKYSWDGTWMPSSGNEMNNKSRTIRVYRRPLTIVNAGVDHDINDFHNIAFNYMLNRRGNDRTDKVDKYFEPSNDVVTKHLLSLTYSQSFFDERWQTSYFVKDYINVMNIKQTDDVTITGSDKIETDVTKDYWGAGVGTRFTLKEPFSVKGSYEHSVRLPLSRELLGNGTTIYPNLALSPETSNNYNLGFFGTWRIDADNMLSYEANGFIRHVQHYIRATVSERDGMMQYVNEPAIDVKGVDVELNYLWRNALQISLNGSWSDARDLKKFKSDGNPSATYKNRVPNRPWIFANAGVNYTIHDLLRKEDRLRVGCDYQWIHWYYLNWEAYGYAQSKAKIPTQNITNLYLTYSMCNDRYNLSLECNNVFDRLAYDNYMLQKPGRAFYAKFRLFIN